MGSQSQMADITVLRQKGAPYRRDGLALGWNGMPRQNPPSSPGSRVLGAPFWQLHGCSPAIPPAPAAPGSGGGGEGRKGRGRSRV